MPFVTALAARAARRARAVLAGTAFIAGADAFYVPLLPTLFAFVLMLFKHANTAYAATFWARHLKGTEIKAYFAGIETHGMNPNAMAVMAEAGVAISTQQSQLVEDLGNIEFDCVVTVCDDAAESCPTFHGKARVVHQPFDAPPRLAQEANTGEEAVAHYPRVRDEIRELVSTLPESIV